MGGIDPALMNSLPEESGERPRWWRASYVTLPVVMLIAIGPIAPYTRLPYLIYDALRGIGINNDLWRISSVGTRLCQVAVLIAIVKWWERRQLASIGVRRPRAVDLGWGVVAFVIIEIGTRAAFRIIDPEASKSVQSQLMEGARSSVSWNVALAASASLFEEMFFRGYAIERMKEMSGSIVVGVLLGTAVDLYLHSTYWDVSYVAAIAFAEVALALLYVWRGSVAPGIVAHFLMDVV